MKLSLLSLATLLVLTGCGGSDGETSCAQDYWDGTYGTCLPADWVVIDSETLRQRGVPSDTLVAFQSDIPVSGQFPTVAVTREPLLQEATPQSYSDASIRAVTVLPEYEELDTRDLVIFDEKVKLHIFKAQPAVKEPLRRFYQVSTVVNEVGYSITATAPVSVEEELENQIILILRESMFADPEAKKEKK